jgi:hypothetical protein
LIQRIIKEPTKYEQTAERLSLKPTVKHVAAFISGGSQKLKNRQYQAAWNAK